MQFLTSSSVVPDLDNDRPDNGALRWGLDDTGAQGEVKIENGSTA